MRKILFTALASFLFTNLFGQVAINSLGVAASENFNTLAATGTTSTTLPTGWVFLESGASLNTNYGIDDGTSNTGNTYSYGTGTNTERAFGTLASNNLLSTIGANYTNQTGSTVTSVTITYTMEQWRRGGSRTTNDTIQFSYGINNTSLSSGTWTRLTTLDGASKILGGTAGSLNGNTPANQTIYSQTFNISLANGQILNIRWVDVNVSGSDDGLGIDDFSITFNANTPVGIPPVSNLIFTANTTTQATINFNKTNYVDSAYSTLVFVKQGSAVTQGTPNAAASNYTANTNFSASSSVFQNDANAKCVLNGDDSTVSITGLVAGTSYHLLVYVIRNTDSVYSAATIGNGTTVAAPAAVTSLGVNTINSVSALRVQWTKPVAYNNTNSTTVVFVKEAAAINNLAPTALGTTFIADTLFTGNGTRFTNDTFARCVYNGDSNIVTIGGLNNNTIYHVLVFHYRLTDSLYSNGVAQSGKTPKALPPSAVTGANFTGVGITQNTLNWIKPIDYIDSTMSVLVFARKNTAVSIGTPTLAANAYTANNNFNLAQVKYENDTNARCVYVGDGSNATITGLEVNTNYHYLVLVLQTVDTLYSLPVTANQATLALPSAVTSVLFTASSARSALLRWTKPVGYSNATHNTLAFVKEVDLINSTLPSANASIYTADTTMGLGTKYQHDTLAFCVFNGDTNRVEIGGLKVKTLYQALILVYRASDSTYATTATGNVTTLDTLPLNAYPNYTISQINKTNLTTGVADSSGVKVGLRGRVLGFNQRTTGIQFALNDVTGGITVFNATKSFGITPISEGDSIYVQGTVSSFRGLCQLNADSVWKGALSSGNFTANAVTKLDENTENILVKLSAVRFATTPTVTSFPATSTNYLIVTSSNDTFTMRVLALSALSGQPIPTTPTFDVTGIGAQFSASTTSPFAFNGYQLYPRSANDIFAIEPPKVPQPVSIASINKTNTTTGNPDSLNAKVYLRGRVLGFNQRTTGLQFVINDATGGITVFNSSKSFGITSIAEGDSMYVQGTVSTFRGLTQVTADTVWKVNGGVANFTASSVTKLDESTENLLVRLNNVRFVTAPTVTTFPTTSTNFLIVTAANDTFTMRVLALSALAGQPVPTTPTFNVTGIGAQFSTSTAAPFAFNGYQLYPRSTNDLAAGSGPITTQTVSIASINKTNATTGLPDSLNAKVNLRGVAIGFNQRTTGLLFVIDDGTGGISLFNSSKNFGYTVKEGDSIYAQGTVAQFRGLTQIAIDTLWKVVGTSSIYAPIGVSNLSETTENKLVRLNGVSFETEPTGNNWPTANTSINIVTANNDVLVLRILATSGLAGKPLPTTETFDVIGLGGQFTTATVPLDGYQIIPRVETDVIEGIGTTDSIGGFDLVSPANNTIITLDSPYTSIITISWRKPEIFGNVDSVLYYFDVDTINGDFTDPYISIETSGDRNDTSITLTEQDVKDIADDLGMVPGEVFYGKWLIYAESVSDFDVFNESNQTRNITIDYVLNSGLKNIGFTQVPVVYPNPASTELNITSKELISSIKLFNSIGEQVLIEFNTGLTTKLDISALNQGLYFVEVNGTNGQRLTKRIVVR